MGEYSRFGPKEDESGTRVTETPMYTPDNSWPETVTCDECGSTDITVHGGFVWDSPDSPPKLRWDMATDFRCRGCGDWVCVTATGEA